MPNIVQKFIDLKISVTTLILWVVGIMTTVAGVSSLYGEQKQRVLNVEQRQERIERSLDRIESSQQRLDMTITRIEGEWKGRVFPPTK